jgi:hypothetical protein
MSIELQKVHKLQIATELLEKALTCYLGEKEYFCAIHLAGGAEEVLGKLVRLDDKKDPLTSWAEAMNAGCLKNYNLDIKGNKKWINHTKNSIKHLDNEDDLYIENNFKKEAEYIIERAINNFRNLNLDYTENMQQYYELQK